MADTNQSVPDKATKQAQSDAQVAAPTAPSEPAKFNIGDLRAHAKELFGVNPEIFDGAFFGVTGTFTKAEAKQKIADFLNKKVSGSSDKKTNK